MCLKRRISVTSADLAYRCTLYHTLQCPHLLLTYPTPLVQLLCTARNRNLNSFSIIQSRLYSRIIYTTKSLCLSLVSVFSKGAASADNQQLYQPHSPSSFHSVIKQWWRLNPHNGFLEQAKPKQNLTLPCDLRSNDRFVIIDSKFGLIYLMYDTANALHSRALYHSRAQQTLHQRWLCAKLCGFMARYLLGLRIFVMATPSRD